MSTLAGVTDASQPHKPVATVTKAYLKPAIDLIFARIRSINYARQAPAWLYIDPETARAYVVSDEHWSSVPLQQQWRDWCVGVYWVPRLPRQQSEHRVDVLACLTEDVSDFLGFPLKAESGSIG